MSDLTLDFWCHAAGWSYLFGGASEFFLLWEPFFYTEVKLNMKGVSDGFVPPTPRSTRAFNFSDYELFNKVLALKSMQRPDALDFKKLPS